MFQILVYCFLFADILFHPRRDLVESEQGIFEQVLHGDLDFLSDPWPSISDSAKDLVKRMLVQDPRRRLTAHEVLCESFFNYPTYFYWNKCAIQSLRITLNWFDF